MTKPYKVLTASNLPSPTGEEPMLLVKTFNPIEQFSSTIIKEIINV
jgi:hypothetical protein